MSEPKFSSQLSLFDNIDDETPKKETVKEQPSDDVIFKNIQKALGDSKNFRILRRIPITIDNIILPYQLSPSVGDEKSLIILDTETTGLDKTNDKIIELGLVKVKFSPSKKQITSVTDVLSAYEDPGMPITPKITTLTGITDEMVKNNYFNDEQINEFLNDVFLIVAHNASFDRPFFEKRFPKHQHESWACSYSNIPWSDLGFMRQSLEALLLQNDYFFDAHRASLDCLALAWLLHIYPQAFELLLNNAQKNTVLIRAFGAPFDVKDQLKSHGYRWKDSGNTNKHWCIEISEENLKEEEDFLNQLYPNASDKAAIIKIDSTKRFK